MPIRAAFDLGSSHHKLQIALVPPSAAPKTLHSTSSRVPLKDKQLPSKHIPQSTLALSLRVITNYKKIADQFKATSFCAIATQVFRESTNGLSHLEKIRQLGIRVVILTPEEEGALGYSTAIWTGGVEEGDVVWDTGGGSSQWSYGNGSRVNVYARAIGTSDVREKYKKLEKSEDAVGQLKLWIREQLKGGHDLRRWVGRGGTVVGIGGDTCIFAIMSEWAEMRMFDVGDVWEYVDELKSERDENNYLPKMVLLGEIMDLFGIQSADYVLTNGNCLGLLVAEEERFWGREEETANDLDFRMMAQGTNIIPGC